MVTDGCYKSLGSLPMPREGWMVQSMDSLTTWKLAGNVVYDSFTTAHMLGHTIDVIFTTFAQEVQSFLPLSLMELFTIPWASIPTGIHAVTSLTYHQSLQVCMCMVLSPAQLFLTYWLMYDPSAKCWKWLFKSAVPTSRSSESSPTPVSPTTHHTAPTSEQLIAKFFNSITLAIKEKVPSIGQNGIKHHWMAEWSCNPMPGSSGYSGSNNCPNVCMFWTKLNTLQ